MASEGTFKAIWRPQRPCVVIAAITKWRGGDWMQLMICRVINI